MGGLPAVGKTYTSRLLAKENNYLSLEFESLRWDFFNEDLEKNLYKYTGHAFLLENENMREYYLRCALYEGKISLNTLIKWQKATLEYIKERAKIIIYELKLINTEKDYTNFCKKYEKIVNYMPKFKNLKKDYVICSHAFINTIDFSKDERIKIDLEADKNTLIKRFKKRENIKDIRLDENINLYYESYSEMLKGVISNKLNTTDKKIITKINKLM